MERTLARTKEILKELGFVNTTNFDCVTVVYVCYMVSTRAAHLCAAGIAQLINRMSKSMVTIGIDGGVYRFHKGFPVALEEKTKELVNPGLKVWIIRYSIVDYSTVQYIVQYIHYIRL